MCVNLESLTSEETGKAESGKSPIDSEQPTSGDKVSKEDPPSPQLSTTEGESK